jgi:hypothetical protein
MKNCFVSLFCIFSYVSSSFIIHRGLDQLLPKANPAATNANAKAPHPSTRAKSYTTADDAGLHSNSTDFLRCSWRWVKTREYDFLRFAYGFPRCPFALDFFSLAVACK